jgi:hypothetical protein
MSENEKFYGMVVRSTTLSARATRVKNDLGMERESLGRKEKGEHTEKIYL